MISQVTVTRRKALLGGTTLTAVGSLGLAPSPANAEAGNARFLHKL
jgi:hypothetical protein